MVMGCTAIAFKTRRVRRAESWRVVPNAESEAS